MRLPATRFPCRLRAVLGAACVALAAGCGGGGQGPAPGAPPSPEPTGTEQTLSDLFNLTALYQRMGRLAGGNPLPFVGSTAFVAGRGDSTIVLLALSLDNRAITFQRAGRQFTARYRVEIGFQREGALPLRFAREEAVSVGSYQETSRADESLVFQQTFLLPAGNYQLSVVVRDPGSTSFSKAEAALVVPAFPPGSFTAPIIAYRSAPRADLWNEPQLILNPRGTVAHGGDSLRVVIEGYGLVGPTRLPLEMRDEQDRILIQRDLEFAGGKAVETRTIQLAPEAPSLGRLTVRTGVPGSQKQAVALVSFSRSWVVTNYDNLLTLLRFLPEEAWVERLRKADPADRPALWRQFWVETDPNPATPENELLEIYFTRVAIANERFRDEGAGQGWRSERGEVFIALGPPDQELESPPGSDQRIVQWVYSEYRAALTFTGQLGFSRLRLTPSSRSEFARLKALARQQVR
jgi:GWxTD domain-containing protein